jgi:hypothetical protein
MAHYLFNFIGEGDDEAALRVRATDWLRAGRWAVNDEERHRDALAIGDLTLIYLGAPVQAFVGRAELASAVRGPAGDVLLTHVEEWDPPVPVADVLARIDTSAGARADFETGVLRVTETEYNVALAVARAREAAHLRDV